MSNKLIMMNEGRIIYSVSGEEKKNLTVDDLLSDENISGKLKELLIKEMGL